MDLRKEIQRLEDLLEEMDEAVDFVSVEEYEERAGSLEALILQRIQYLESKIEDEEREIQEYRRTQGDRMMQDQVELDFLKSS